MNNREALGRIPPCAACKHQRKRCEINCLLAPYFPPNKYPDYVNAHKLFGLSNITRMISSVPPDQRQTTANTLMTQGNMRSNDPVYGCLGLVHYLLTQIELSQKELDFVNSQLFIFRAIDQQSQAAQQNVPIEESVLASTLFPALHHLGLFPFPALSSMPPLLPEFDAGPSQPSLPSIPQFGASYPLPPISDSSSSCSSLEDQIRGLFPSDVPNLGEVLSIGDSKMLEQGYNYQITVEDGEDVKPFDLRPIDQAIESFQYQQVFPNFGEPGESSNVEWKTYGKKPVDCGSDEESENGVELP